jgi:hypothetical protein
MTDVNIYASHGSLADLYIFYNDTKNPNAYISYDELHGWRLIQPLARNPNPDVTSLQISQSQLNPYARTLSFEMFHNGDPIKVTVEIPLSTYDRHTKHQSLESN